jgi:hypothetical protein
MLAQGDYAIAFPHSFILYHGFRQSSDSALTYEGASSLASSLQESNERSAVRMARCAFPRFCFRVSQFKDEIQQYIEQATEATTAPLVQLLASLEKKISGSNVVLVREAAEKQVLIRNLTKSVTKHMANRKLEKLSYAEFEAELLKAIVNHKTKSHKTELWSLGSEGLAEVSNDFKLLLDFHFGSQKRDFERFLRTLGKLFLRDTERQEYEALQADDATKLAWLKQRVEPRLHPLWYFVVSFSRLLQTADYSLQPDEAIDEVRGSGLPNIREGVESMPVEQAPAVAAHGA